MLREREAGLPAGARGVERLEIETKTRDGVTVVKLKGRLSMGPALDRFKSTLGDLLNQGRTKIVLDLEEMQSNRFERDWHAGAVPDYGEAGRRSDPPAEAFEVYGTNFKNGGIAESVRHV